MNEFEYVLIDMSPSVGALNQCLLMSSDFFMVPTFPDFFCGQAIHALSSVLPGWHTAIAKFRDVALTYPIPMSPPLFLGVLSQKYRPRMGAPAKSFQRWIDTIGETVIQQLVPELLNVGMAITAGRFAQCVPGGTQFNIANIADFNSLIAQSQKHNVPVFALTDAQIEQQGVVLDKMKENRDTFREVFKKLAADVKCLVA